MEEIERMTGGREERREVRKREQGRRGEIAMKVGCCKK